MRTRVGYAGGTSRSPTYHRIGNHAEVLAVDYDTDVFSYAALLKLFWAAHDPTRPSIGTQYQAAVFAADENELLLARALGERAAAERGGALKTRIIRLDQFYRAEDYHQKYRLRSERELAVELGARYPSDEAMVDSTSAARINGLLSGYGRRANLAALLPRLALSPLAEKKLWARVP